jgi:hypothetical protein
MIYDLDDAGPVIQLIQRERSVKARKPHRCARCSDPIQAGEMYLRTAYTVDGEMRIERTHVSEFCYI